MNVTEYMNRIKAMPKIKSSWKVANILKEFSLLTHRGVLNAQQNAEKFKHLFLKVRILILVLSKT